MTILFDQGTPVPLRGYLTGHSIDTAAELGWSRLTNGDLLARAEADGYDCLVTTDQNLKYQQNLAERKIGIVVRMSASWPRIQKKASEVSEAVASISEGGYAEVAV